MASSKKIATCYASSNEYAIYTGISLLSLLKNNKEIISIVYILSFGIDENNIAKLVKICEIYECPIKIVNAEDRMKDTVKMLNMNTFGGSYATYARAFISEIISDFNDVLLYIDSDTIIDGSIKKLTHIDFEDKVYAAVIGMNQYKYPFDEIKLINGNKTYYACGVLLFNLKNWRIKKCTELIKNFINNSKCKDFRYADQTVINNSIPDSLAIKLPLEFNYWGHIFRGRRLYFELSRNGYYSKKDIDRAKANPIIIHYKGHVVHPWLTGNISSLSDRYQYYKKLSPWKSEPEHSIYYSEEHGKETKAMRKVVNATIRYIRHAPLVVLLIEYIVRIKHKVLGR